jgi:hypothetical protein
MKEKSLTCLSCGVVKKEELAEYEAILEDWKRTINEEK